MILAIYNRGVTFRSALIALHLPLNDRRDLANVPSGPRLDERGVRGQTQPVYVTTSVNIIQSIEHKIIFLKKSHIEIRFFHIFMIGGNVCIGIECHG